MGGTGRCGGGPHGRTGLLRGDAFGNKGARASLTGQNTHPGALSRGEHHHLDIGQEAANLGGGLHPVKPGHAPVHQDHIGTQSLGRLCIRAARAGRGRTGVQELSCRWQAPALQPRVATAPPGDSGRPPRRLRSGRRPSTSDGAQVASPDEAGGDLGEEEGGQDPCPVGSCGQGRRPRLVGPLGHAKSRPSLAGSVKPCRIQPHG
jgi:hypothetical protein